jgi:DNA gyrase subunit A
VAKEGLMARFELSEIQAQTILDMRLQRLTGLERDKIVSDYNEIIEKITWLKQVLGDDTLVIQIIREEFDKILEEYGDGRRTEIIDAPDEILPEDLITPEEMVVTVSRSGYIKRNPINLYRAQRRGGKGIKGMVTLDDDFVTSLYTASSLDTFLFFTNKGRVFWRKVYQLPMAGRTARGKAIINLLELGEGEKVAAILPVANLANADNSVSVLTVTKLGRVKKTFISEYKRPLRKGKFGLTIRDDDEILSAAITSGNDNIILVTRKGLSIHFHENDVRAMGRLAAGVKGISLSEGDEVVGVAVLQSDDSILTVTENGYGKRTAVAEYRLQSRGGKGVFTIKTSERNGNVVGVMPVVDEDQVMLIANSGKIIRMPMDTVRIIGRNTQGVRLINLEEGEFVVDMCMLAREEAVDGEDIDGIEDENGDE